MEKNNREQAIPEYLSNHQRLYDAAYARKYNRRIQMLLRLLAINSVVCVLLLMAYVHTIHDTIDVTIYYTFFSMLTAHLLNMAYLWMYWNDIKTARNGEAMYLKAYYPDVWAKINPYGHIIARGELLRYQYGKYIPRNTDPVIDAIRRDNRRWSWVSALPLALWLLFTVIALALS